MDDPGVPGPAVDLERRSLRAGHILCSAVGLEFLGRHRDRHVLGAYMV